MSRSLTGAWFGILGMQAIAGIFSLATAALASLLVPPPVFGSFSLMMSIVQVTYGVGFAWLNHALFRYAREEHGARGTVAGVLFPVLMGHMLLLAGAAYLLAKVANPLAYWLDLPVSILKWCIVGVAALACFEALSYAAQAQGRFRGYGLGQVATKAGPLMVTLLFPWVAGGGSIVLFAGAVAGWLFAATLTAKAVNWAPARPYATSALISYGWRLPFGTASGVLATWIGVWFVRAHLGLAEAGLYAWANALFGLIAAFLIPLSAVIAPRMVDLRLGGDTVGLTQNIRLTLAVALLASALTPAALSFLHFVASAAPDAYEAAIPVLVVLCGAAPAQFLSYVLNPLLMAHEDLVGRCVVANICVAASIAGGNVMMVPHLGMLGAAWATLIALWFAGFLWLVIASTLVRPARVAWRMWILAAFPTLAVVAVMSSLPVLLAIMTGVVATLVLLAAGRQLGFYDGVEELSSHVPRPLSALGRGLMWCARRS
jgi:O-antigen/teichoic acid export membrane protein